MALKIKSWVRPCNRDAMWSTMAPKFETRRHQEPTTINQCVTDNWTRITRGSNNADKAFIWHWEDCSNNDCDNNEEIMRKIGAREVSTSLKNLSASGSGW